LGLSPKILGATPKIGDDQMKKDLNNDGKVTMTEEILAALGTYARAFLSAAIALYMTGNTNPRDLLMGGVAAVAPVILKALSPSNSEFGFKNKK
jgi:hypothetical protein